MNVNYIKHLEQIHSAFVGDSRITPFHISLYMALFHQWNSAMFPAQLSIARSEIMRFSKIGSVNTYTRCLKELHQFGYIEYLPSNNPYLGSVVNLYRFDNSSDNSSDHSSCLKSDNSCDNTSEIVVRPYINSINNNKPINNINDCRVDLQADPQPQSKPKKKNSIFSPPSQDEVKAFFQEKNRSNLEAEKFFNYFESNGWLVGGKSKMKNWQAAARNWILNSEKFSKTRLVLDATTDKRYDIPL